MVQFNLLPDVKIQYLKARRQEHLVILISTFAIIAGLAVVVILVGTVYGVQKKSLSDLNKDIKSDSQQLQSTSNLSKILTVQNQLKTLPTLDDQKPVATRLAGFLSQITPSSVGISKLDVDFTKSSMSIAGSADTINTVTVFADTLKSTTYTVKGGSSNGKPAFSGVVLANFSRDKNGATYNITLNFDQAIFSEDSDVNLAVPTSQIPARSAVSPTALFQNTTPTTANGQ